MAYDPNHYLAVRKNNATFKCQLFTASSDSPASSLAVRVAGLTRFVAKGRTMYGNIAGYYRKNNTTYSFGACSPVISVNISIQKSTPTSGVTAYSIMLEKIAVEVACPFDITIRLRRINNLGYYTSHTLKANDVEDKGTPLINLSDTNVSKFNVYIYATINGAVRTLVNTNFSTGSSRYSIPITTIPLYI